jgi:translocation and assembly module TamA
MTARWPRASVGSPGRAGAARPGRAIGTAPLRSWSRAHAALVLACLAVTACHTPPPRHPGQQYLAGIALRGNRAFSANDLRAGLALREVEKRGAAPDPYLIAEDASRIRGMYLREGYFSVTVDSRVVRQGDATIVVYTIHEGARAHTQIEITGLPPDVSPDKVRAALPLRDGAPFSYEPYDKAKPALLAVLENAGYAHAQLDAKVVAEPRKQVAEIQLAYDPGPRSTFGEITITGAEPALVDAVRARVRFHPGDAYSRHALDDTQRQIYKMKRFQEVRVTPEPSDGATIPVKIALVVGARHEITLGGGVGIDPASYLVRARTGYSIDGWPFPLETLTLDLRPAFAILRDGSGTEPRIEANALLSRIDMLAPFITGELGAGYNYITVEAYTSIGPHASIGLHTPLVVRGLELRAAYQFEYYDFRALSPLVGPEVAQAIGLDRPQRVGELQQEVLFDRRDSPLEPTEGFYADVLAEEAFAALGSADQFTMITPDLRGFIPVGPVVVALRARYGTFFGTVPPTERFYLGGATSQRGFSERRLAPTLSGIVNGSFRSVPIGGSTMAETNLELRSKLGTIHGMKLGGAVFLDGGDVTLTRAALDLGNLNWAVGAGLRLYTLIGPIRFDFGYRLNRTGPTDPEPRSHYAFHLSIGEAF